MVDSLSKGGTCIDSHIEAIFKRRFFYIQVNLYDVVEKKKLLKKLDLEEEDKVGGVLGRFKYKKKRYMVTMENASEATQIVNLRNDEEEDELKLGTPFVRHINIIEDVLSELTEGIKEEDTKCPDRCIYNEVKQKEGLVIRSVAVGCVVERNEVKKSTTSSPKKSKKRKSPSSKSPSSKSPSKKKKKKKAKKSKK